MTRGLPAGLSTDFQSATPTPVLLFDLATGKTPANVRFTRYGRAVTFAGVVFSSRRCEIEEVRVQGTSQASTLRIRVDDTDGTFHALVAAGADFLNQRVKRYATKLSSTGGASTDAQLDIFAIDAWDRAGRAFSFTLKPLTACFDVEVPKRRLTHEDFPWLPEEAG